MKPLIDEQLEIIRRIAENGLHYMLSKKDSLGVDNFQHMLDELYRLKDMLGKESGEKV